MYTISRFWPYCIKIVHDVNIVIKSWRGAQGQGLTIDIALYVSAIKIGAYGSRASQAQYKLRHHVNMQFNKIPTTSYAMQQEMPTWFSQGIGRKIIQTLNPIMLSQMSMREPIKLSTTYFVLYIQSFNSSRSWLM